MNTNLVLAISALLVSSCALFMSIQEVRILRDQQRATMYPYLTVSALYTSEGYGLVLKNSGNGLARVNSHIVQYDSLIITDWAQFIDLIDVDTSEIGYHNIWTTGSLTNQMVIPGEERRLIFLAWNESSRKIEKYLKNIEVRISYSSLLDEHWTITNRRPHPIEEMIKYNPQNEFN